MTFEERLGNLLWSLSEQPVYIIPLALLLFIILRGIYVFFHSAFFLIFGKPIRGSIIGYKAKFAHIYLLVLFPFIFPVIEFIGSTGCRDQVEIKNIGRITPILPERKILLFLFRDKVKFIGSQEGVKIFFSLFAGLFIFALLSPEFDELYITNTALLGLGILVFFKFFEYYAHGGSWKNLGHDIAKVVRSSFKFNSKDPKFKMSDIEYQQLRESKELLTYEQVLRLQTKDEIRNAVIILFVALFIIVIEISF